MNLKPCRVCKHKVNQDSDRCPNCGVPKNLHGGLTDCLYCGSKIYVYIETECPKCGTDKPLISLEEKQIMKEIEDAQRIEDSYVEKFTELGKADFITAWFVEKKRKEYIRLANVAQRKVQKLGDRLHEVYKQRMLAKNNNET